MTNRAGRRHAMRAAAAAWVLCAVGGALAQIPDEFTNLKVLPKDIGRDQLISVMRGFSDALGVRCKFCHVGESDTSIEGYDFASDDREQKRVARAMMGMTDRINNELLPTTGREHTMRVRCVTCHRGVDQPHGLDEILLGVIEHDGVAAAEAKYRELRKEYYGAGGYDFGAETLDGVAEELAEGRKDLRSAIAIELLNVETHPDSAKGHTMLARLYTASDDREKALASIHRALELDPENPYARRMLERMSPAE